MKPTLSILCAALLAGALRAQCSDPTPPPTGFSLTTLTDQLVTYSDGFKTRADYRYPAVSPGPCGWPLLLLVHGFPGSKAGMSSEAIRYAQLGFFVVTYDVRGQGSSIALNPGKGTTLMGLAEWIDMFEEIETALAKFPKLIDAGRIGVAGFSQGGAHAWAAAAYSGRTPPANPRRSKRFPVIKAVVSGGMAPSHTEVATSGGTAFKSNWPLYAYTPSLRSVSFDPALKTVWAGFLNADNPEGNAKWMWNDPGRDFVALLKSTSTAIFCSALWLDAGSPVNPALKLLQSLPKTTPWRIHISTGGHGTPRNTREEIRKRDLKTAWLLRFLKGAKDPVELGPKVFSAVLPADPAAYLSSQTIWRTRADVAFPPPSARTAVWYLRRGGILSPTPPASPEPADRITHSVPAGYTARSWLADGAGTRLGLVLLRMPLSNQSYLTPAFSQDVEVAGFPQVVLEVSPLANRFYLSARLDVVTARGTQILSVGGSGIRQSGAPKKTTLTLELSGIDAVIPKGARLKLSVRNHFLEQPGARIGIKYMPYLSSYQVDIEHSPGRLSRLLLPLRPAVGMDLTSQASGLSLSSPSRLGFQLRSSAASSGRPYLVLAGLSGQGPAVALPGGALLYLKPDAATQLFIAILGTPLVPNFAGVLDAAGAAAPALDLRAIAPLPPQLLGRKLDLCAIDFAGAFVHASAPLRLVFGK